MLNIATTLFLSGIFLGFGPCLASCGPILISFIAASGLNARKAFWAWLIFSLARMLAYCILGILAFYGLHIFIGPAYTQRIAKIFYLSGAGFIIISGIVLFLGVEPGIKFCNIFHDKFLKSEKKSFFILGLVIGGLPCGPLLGIFAGIVLMSKNILDCLFLNLSFGLGTMLSPLLILALLSGSIEKFLKNQRARIIFNRVCGIFIICLGIMMAIGHF